MPYNLRKIYLALGYLAQEPVYLSSLYLHVDDKKASRISDIAIVIRWHKLFKSNWVT
ncbi:hypothetical protein PPIS_b1048 [Pseudoalteromonas piscicida]|uniref:Uncharacterized protein n=1 Tax=Pseudoalteromonas piscicida TaxID=43662 RepID=A0ABN5CS36_PSEO7|nr:hypothetical protein PPIS_b1048 [Pseudoalteromonas piscicida]